MKFTPVLGSRYVSSQSGYRERICCKAANFDQKSYGQEGKNGRSLYSRRVSHQELGQQHSQTKVILCWPEAPGSSAEYEYPSTLDNAYDALINSITDTAQEHLSIADALSSQVVEVLRMVEKRSDDSKKKVVNSTLFGTRKFEL